MAERGCLIAFEGVEGAGKSTQLRLAAAALRERGVAVVETREPGGTDIGAELRRIVMHPTGVQPAPMTELLLYLADREALRRFDAPITPPPVFTWIQETGGVSVEEMYRTFNMGMGYAYVVPEKSVGCVQKMVKGAKVVGEVVEEPGAWLLDAEIR